MLTINPEKYKFGSKEIKFWGMIFSVDRMQPDPAKINALNFTTAPTNRNDHISFLCMMQSNLDFILNFIQKAEPLRELTHQNTHFRWKPIHQKCFEILILDFKKDTVTILSREKENFCDYKYPYYQFEGKTHSRRSS